MLDPGDLAAHRRTIHMAENTFMNTGDAGYLAGTQPKLARRQAGPTDDTTPSAGLTTSLSSAGVTRTGSRRKGAPGGQDEADPEQVRREKAEQQRHHAEGADERVSLLVDGDERVLDGID